MQEIETQAFVGQQAAYKVPVGLVVLHAVSIGIQTFFQLPAERDAMFAQYGLNNLLDRFVLEYPTIGTVGCRPGSRHNNRLVTLPIAIMDRLPQLPHAQKMAVKMFFTTTVFRAHFQTDGYTLANMLFHIWNTLVGRKSDTNLEKTRYAFPNVQTLQNQCVFAE